MPTAQLQRFSVSSNQIQDTQVSIPVYRNTQLTKEKYLVLIMLYAIITEKDKLFNY